jgi:hypothetical protein
LLIIVLFTPNNMYQSNSVPHYHECPALQSNFIKLNVAEENIIKFACLRFLNDYASSI